MRKGKMRRMARLRPDGLRAAVEAGGHTADQGQQSGGNRPLPAGLSTTVKRLVAVRRHKVRQHGALREQVTGNENPCLGPAAAAANGAISQCAQKRPDGLVVKMPPGVVNHPPAFSGPADDHSHDWSCHPVSPRLLAMYSCVANTGGL